MGQLLTHPLRETKKRCRENRPRFCPIINRSKSEKTQRKSAEVSSSRQEVKIRNVAKKSAEFPSSHQEVKIRKDAEKSAEVSSSSHESKSEKRRIFHPLI
jgi:hypothetical protein